jgi:hypothetical protein
MIDLGNDWDEILEDELYWASAELFRAYGDEKYRKTFEEIWNRLRELKIADKTISEIHNSELFKFSPYKNLNFEMI